MILYNVNTAIKKEGEEMTVEERLKDLIIRQYGTMKDFTDHIGIPNSTFANILRRGVQNANVLTIIKICQALGISTDDLAEGRIVPVNRPVSEPTSIEDIIEDTKQKLLNGGNLTLDGQPASANDIYAIISALEVSLEVGKKHSLMAAKKEMKKKDDEQW